MIPIALNLYGTLPLKSVTLHLIFFVTFHRNASEVYLVDYLSSK
jgi:hypothetical protein